MTYIQSTTSPPPRSPSIGSPSTSFSPSSYNSSPIRHSPLSQPPIIARDNNHNGSTRKSSPILSTENEEYISSLATPIPKRNNRRSSLSPITSFTTPSPSSSSTASFTARHNVQIQSSPTITREEEAYSSQPISPRSSLSRSHPLLGSYHLSLLHSRMSHAHQPHKSSPSTNFSLNIISLGKGKSCPKELRYPDPIEIPFSSTYYDINHNNLDSSYPSTLSNYSSSKSTPWTSNVNIENHYFDTFSSTTTTNSLNDLNQTKPPSFPGYQVSPIGQLQILVKTAETPIKVFLLPYDLRKVPIGGRLLVREKTYFRIGNTSNGDSIENRKGILKYAIQLQFVCVPSSNSLPHHIEDDIDNPYTTRYHRIGSTTTGHSQEHGISRSLPSTPTSYDQSGKSFYLSKSLKLVFVSCPPDRSEIMDLERTDEIIEPPSSVHPISHSSKRRRDSFAFSPGSLGKTSEDWEILRRKWHTKNEIGIAQVENQQLIMNPNSNILAKRELELNNINQPERTRKPSLISATSPSPSPAPATIPLPQFIKEENGSSVNHQIKRSLSPISILSPLPLKSGSISRSRPSTPTSPRPISPHVNEHGPALIWSPKSQRRMRREDGLEEVELSERLRRMELGKESEQSHPEKCHQLNKQRCRRG
ncbi:uncharacterized protein L201_003654 [Kwoniella dendrophila CBS 6074]|uniref:Atos-like conserved domain-containing protein n=1 Tax=Kwoniella dendrophila CBS 6074 TaxID=1295534 RepID=A0AAX4JTK1_9TREE